MTVTAVDGGGDADAHPDTHTNRDSPPPAAASTRHRSPPAAVVVVTITASTYGQAGGVTETLPTGFGYVSSSLPDSQVTELSGNRVRFTLQGENSFTYTVTASNTADTYTFTGMLRDFDRNDYNVGGASRVTVRATPGGPSATRSFDRTTVTAGEQVTVTIAVSNYGQGGGVTERLPTGFGYVSSSLPASQVTQLAGNKVRFTLQGETSFTYTVTTPNTADTYTFAGTLRDFDRNDHNVTGDSSVTVEAVPGGPEATRSLSATSVDPGASVTVTITARNYGQGGGVTEMLPAGFTYISSDLPASQVNVSGQDVRFTLQDESSFTYTVTASATTGAYTFAGTLRDFDRNDHNVGGDSRIIIEAPEGTASRSFSPSRVDPGADVTVTINTGDYGQLGAVTEWLPAGFSYGSSSLDNSQVAELSGNRVRFTLQGDTSFTYTATTPGTADTYDFYGELRDSNRMDTSIGGDTSLRVAPAPTPTPTATATAVPEPDPTPTPRRVRRTPTPTVTPTPIPSTPVPAITSPATPVPPTATPTPPAEFPVVGDTTPTLVFPIMLMGIALLVVGGGTAIAVRSLRQR